jgi:hypothetical protein
MSNSRRPARRKCLCGNDLRQGFGPILPILTHSKYRANHIENDEKFCQNLLTIIFPDFA